MMEDGQLPAELDRLERFLASGSRPEPSPALRERVLNAALSQVRRQHMFRLVWAAAATVAATVLLCVGFSYLFLAAFAGVHGEHVAPRDQVGGVAPVNSPQKLVVVEHAPTGGTVSVSVSQATLPIPELARRIQELSPEITREEATRRAVLLHIAVMTGGQPALAEQLRKLKFDELPAPRPQSTDSRNAHNAHSDPR